MSVRVLDVAQGSPAWHAARARRYGASELPQIAGLSGSAARVWRGKLGAPEQLSALWLELGHLLEPWALQLWSRETGRDVQPGPVLVQDRGWLLASWDGASGDEPVEAKIRGMGAPDRAAWGEETIPAAVELQVRQQAALGAELTGRWPEAAHVSCLLLDGYGLTHRVYRIALTPERREEWGDVWAPYAPRWHAAYVLPRVPPPDATAADVAVLVEPGRVQQRDATADELALVARLAELDAARAAADRAARAATKARDEVRDALARSLGPGACVPGVRWASRRNQRPTLKLETDHE